MGGFRAKGDFEVMLSWDRGLLICWQPGDWGAIREGLLFRPHMGKETKATEKEAGAGPEAAGFLGKAGFSGAWKHVQDLEGWRSRWESERVYMAPFAIFLSDLFSAPFVSTEASWATGSGQV